jgi:hypothetical protein
MTIQTIRGAVALAMATPLLACADLPDDAVVEDEAVAVAAQDADDEEEPTLIPLVVTLYQHPDFYGEHRLAYKSEAYLGHGQECVPGLGFDDTVSSVRVRKGPDYDEWRRRHDNQAPYVYLHQDHLYRGRRIALTMGGYPDLRDLYFENMASSLTIQPEPQRPANLREPTDRMIHEVDPVSIILEAHTEPRHLRCSGHDEKMTLIWSTPNIGRAYGSAFDDKLSSIDILRASAFDPNLTFVLYGDPDYSYVRQRGFYHDSQSIDDLGDRTIDNMVSSILIRRAED